MTARIGQRRSSGPLRPTPLTPNSLNGLGSIIGTHGSSRSVNAGISEKWDRLVPPDIFCAPMNLGILRTRYTVLAVTRLERHLHTHQFFVPMAPRRFAVVVAGNDPARPHQIAAYISDGSNGVNFYPGTWHSPIIPVDETVTLLTAMRDSKVPDIDLRELAEPIPLNIEGTE